MPEPRTTGEKEGDGLVMAENAHGGGGILEKVGRKIGR